MLFGLEGLIAFDQALLSSRGKGDFGCQTPSQILQLLIFDLPGDTTDQRLHPLPN